MLKTQFLVVVDLPLRSLNQPVIMISRFSLMSLPHNPKLHWCLIKRHLVLASLMFEKALKFNDIGIEALNMQPYIM